MYTLYQERIANEVFGLGLPVTTSVLRSRFRELAKGCHPDLGGDAEEFKELKGHFDFLVAYAVDESKEEKSGLTYEGVHISTLGRGYPLLVHAVSCLPCEGRGWNKVYLASKIYRSCDRCREGRGRDGRRCGYCLGEGELVRITSVIKRILLCTTCEGKGEVRVPNAVLKRGDIAGKRAHNKKARRRYAKVTA